MSRHALMTGASRGIGRAIACQLASDRSDISMHCRSGRAKASAIVADIQASEGSACVLQFNVCDCTAYRTQLDVDVETHDACYDIILRADIMRDAIFPALTGEDWDIVLETGLDGFYNVAHPLTMPMMRARKGGCIVVVASVSEVMGNRGQVNYSVAKTGLIGATKVLAVEPASRKIVVNCVVPGLIEMDMLAHMEHMDQALQAILIQRVGQPAEVTAAAGLLISDTASYVTQ